MPVALPGRPPPTSRPQAQRQLDYVPFDGMLRDRHTTEDGAEYIRLVRPGLHNALIDHPIAMHQPWRAGMGFGSAGLV